MKWFSLIWQLVVTLGAALVMLQLLGVLICLSISGIAFALVVLFLVARELNDAGGELPSFSRFLEVLGMGVLIGFLWPIIPIVFARRAAVDADEPVGDA